MTKLEKRINNIKSTFREDAIRKKFARRSDDEMFLKCGCAAVGLRNLPMVESDRVWLIWLGYELLTNSQMLNTSYAADWRERNEKKV